MLLDHSKRRHLTEFQPLSGDDLERWSRLGDEELEAELAKRGLSDGLPVARLARAALEEALRSAGLEPGDMLATVPLLRGRATAEVVAAWSLLAGCRPKHVGVVAACVRALDAPELNTLGVLTTTGNAALMAVVSGPAASRLGFSGTGNCLGPGTRANATVGRALSLITRNVGGAVQGLGDMATMGQPAKYGFCFAENEADSPWQPLHVERGLRADQSAVTVVGVSGVLEVVNSHAGEAADLLQTMADVMAVPAAALSGDRAIQGGGHPIVLISPEWAATLAAEGLSKSDVKRELHARAAWPGGSGLRVAASPEDVLVIVAGGVGIKQTFIPNWNGGSVPVTVPI